MAGRFLAQAHVPTLFSLQPELLTTSKRPYSRRSKIRGLYAAGEPASTHVPVGAVAPRYLKQMTEAAQRDHFTSWIWEDTLGDVREKAFTDYCHLTPRGNERIAEQLYRPWSPLSLHS